MPDNQFSAKKIQISLSVDGNSQNVEVSPRTLLVQALRDQMGVTAPHIGCESGRCGACAVTVDGAAVKSCMMLAVQADQSRIETASSLQHDPIGSVLQRAFKNAHALQCGFCTQGMLTSAKALLQINQSPTTQDVRDWLRGNLCRCTGYQHIIEAVVNAAEELRGAP